MVQVNASHSSSHTSHSGGVHNTSSSTYHVHKGDTLSGIAARHGITLDALTRANPAIAHHHFIFPGDRLTIPAATSNGHVVRRGETLTSIARQSGTSVQALARANHIANPNRIHVGDRLIIPSRAAQGAQTPHPVATQQPVAKTPAQVTPNATTPTTAAQTQTRRATNDEIGGLSARYESGGRGVGTISGGVSDPGGVSYGIHQLSSAKGTARAFVRSAEGAPYAARFAGKAVGSPEFNATWRAIAREDPRGFERAQHQFIERTHYQPALNNVADRTGLDLNSRADGVREAVWSVSVQHAGAATILNDAVARTDRQFARTDARYDRALINNIYDRRTEYVLGVAANNRNPNERAQLIGITRNRYPNERADALALLDRAPQSGRPSATEQSGATASPATGPSGNGVLTRWPVANPRLNVADKAGEGDGHYGTARSRGSHGGVDLVGPVGSPVMAAGAGRVVDIQPNPSQTYGYQVVIDHGNGVFTQYAHLQAGSTTVRPGDTVTAGQQIAAIGRTGNTPAQGDAHLHFEVRLGSERPRAAGGRTANPLDYLGQIPR
jgi:murein DD-endopeptidase MepM/ murein hydrolase activator NlpD